MENEVTILQLNDDCLLHIVLMLDQNDQERMKRVCQRFEQLVNCHWRLKYREWARGYTDDEQDTDDERDKAELAWMAYHLHDFVADLNVDTLLDPELDILATTKFPNTHTLTAYCEGISDKRLDVLVDVFPNLQKLTLEGNLELRTLAKLCNLTELTLWYNYYDDVLHFNAIFTQLKLRTLSFRCSDVCEMQGLSCIRHCKTLEEVSAGADILNDIAPMLHELPKLRMIACYAYGKCNPVEKNIFQTIVGIFGKRIYTLISDNSVYYFPMDELAKMENLERWIMKDLSVSDFRSDRLARDLKNLRELQLINWKTIESEPGEYIDWNPLDLIAACSQLKLLAMPYEWLQDDLDMVELWNVLKDMIPGPMEPPLELRLLHGKPDPVLIRDLISAYGKQLHITITEEWYPAEVVDRYSCYYYSYRMFRIYLDSSSHEIN